jgi:hypothetical protein
MTNSHPTPLVLVWVKTVQRPLRRSRSDLVIELPAVAVAAVAAVVAVVAVVVVAVVGGGGEWVDDVAISNLVGNDDDHDGWV